jgi:hypothetical protein
MVPKISFSILFHHYFYIKLNYKTSLYSSFVENVTIQSATTLKSLSLAYELASNNKSLPKPFPSSFKLRGAQIEFCGLNNFKTKPKISLLVSRDLPVVLCLLCETMFRIVYKLAIFL